MKKLPLPLAFLLLATGAFAADSPAGLFVEPMVTYEVGETRVGYPAPFSSSTADTTSFNYGPVVGAQLPTQLAMRVWAGYVFDGEIDFERANNVDLKLKDGEGYRVGVGVKLAIVSLNLEYQDINYDKVNLANSGLFTGRTTGLRADNQAYVFSVSFPFSL